MFEEETITLSEQENEKIRLFHLFIPAIEESWSNDVFKDQTTCFIRVVLKNKHSPVNIKIHLHYEPGTA